MFNMWEGPKQTRSGKARGAPEAPPRIVYKIDEEKLKDLTFPPIPPDQLLTLDKSVTRGGRFLLA